MIFKLVFGCVEEEEGFVNGDRLKDTEANRAVFAVKKK